MAIPANQAKPDRIYTSTTFRSLIGRCYFKIATDAQARRIVKRLGARGFAALTTDELYQLKAARDHLAGRSIMARMFTRWTSSTTGERVESKRWQTLRKDHRLRQVASKPGYTS